jgi:hypothetical protein
VVLPGTLACSVVGVVGYRSLKISAIAKLVGNSLSHGNIGAKIVQPHSGRQSVEFANQIVFTLDANMFHTHAGGIGSGEISWEGEGKVESVSTSQDACMAVNSTQLKHRFA